MEFPGGPARCPGLEAEHGADAGRVPGRAKDMDTQTGFGAFVPEEFGFGPVLGHDEVCAPVVVEIAQG